MHLRIHTCSNLLCILQADAVLTDVTEDYAIIALTGPTSRTLLESFLGHGKLTPDVLPFGAGRWMTANRCKIWVQKLSYAGELGYELYINAADAELIYDIILSTASEFDAEADITSKIGLTHAGSIAQNILRLEKGFVHYGHDVFANQSPLEAGMGFAVSLKKPDDFIGKEKYLKERDAGVSPVRHLFKVEGIPGPKQLIPTDSPIYSSGRNVVGEVTSGAYSFVYDTAIIMAHIDPDFMDDALELEIGRDRFKLSRLPRGCLHDPDGVLMKG